LKNPAVNPAHSRLIEVALLPVDDALSRILKGVKPLAAESVRLLQAHGRVLAKPVRATRDQPPFDASAMDGYALRQQDIATLPVTLLLAGTSAAGHAFRGSVRKGEAIRILTGAPVPKGADTIVIQENTRVSEGAVAISEPTMPGKNIRKRGLDFAKGDTLLEHSITINARDIGLAAAGNAPLISVRKKPHVVLFTTGDELVQPGQRPRADQIVSSNSSALEAMFTAWGARVTNLGIIPDRLSATKRAIAKGLGADILVTTGGASVGDTDFVRQGFRECGVKIDFWKIALRPGKPLMYGTKDKCRVIGLPGNPVSALVCSRIFIKPLIDALMGKPDNQHPAKAKLSSPLQANDSRQDYIRATLSFEADGTRTADAFVTQDSSMQRTLRNAQCLIIRKPLAPATAAGDEVDVLLLDF
jgi:molybdopterin molybdotransferase